MDHRCGERMPVDINVRITCRPHAIGTGRLESVSASGAWVRTQLAPPPLSSVKITADVVTADGTERYETMGYVVRATPSGIAVEWCELAPALVRAIRTNLYLIDAETPERTRARPPLMRTQ